LDPPRQVGPGSVMQIDAATRRNLELMATLAGERKGSLVATIDRTVTAAGARLLAEHVAAPLTEPRPIAARLDAVQFFVDRPELGVALRERLKRCPDIERAVTRLSLGRGGPRDLAALRQSLGETAARWRSATTTSSVTTSRCRPTMPASSGRGSSTARQWRGRSATRRPNWPILQPRSPAPPNGP